ncbi:hypothetical protein [Candidatus Contubernalis alkaliaceticus]|uniref:hypothetical protein n=1 Tax=Candidatus Contubernalis alkaliaceticus TaxID=338645 RepID=UPI001F4C38F2|nr:hypothetical protein [Candidatus Contubernalis alkalaceticus]UNC92728.1 hypothetical protein HUE98_11845 [Candidatus Contubernalis alkalaceticus]
MSDLLKRMSDLKDSVVDEIVEEVVESKKVSDLSVEDLEKLILKASREANKHLYDGLNKRIKQIEFQISKIPTKGEKN